MVEHNLAKVGVAGSNPVSRSKFKSERRRTQVAKGEVCKTFMQRFKSARRLHTLSFLASALALILFSPSLSIAANEDGVRVFKDALSRYRSGDYAVAAKKFTAARTALPVLGDYTLYFRAKALDELKSYSQA